MLGMVQLLLWLIPLVLSNVYLILGLREDERKMSLRAYPTIIKGVPVIPVGPYLRLEASTDKEMKVITTAGLGFICR